VSDAFDPYAPNSQNRYEAMASARSGDGVVSSSVGYYLAETLCERVANLALVDGFVPIPNPVFWPLGHRSLPVTLSPLSDASSQ